LGCETCVGLEPVLAKFVRELAREGWVDIGRLIELLESSMVYYVGCRERFDYRELARLLSEAPIIVTCDRRRVYHVKKRLEKLMGAKVYSRLLRGKHDRSYVLYLDGQREIVEKLRFGFDISYMERV